MARPGKFSEDLFARILERLAQGESLLQICTPDDMPWRNVFMRWLDVDEERRIRYVRARDDGLDVLAEQLLRISDNTEPGVIVTDKPLTGVETTTPHMNN